MPLVLRSTPNIESNVLDTPIIVMYSGTQGISEAATQTKFIDKAAAMNCTKLHDFSSEPQILNFCLVVIR